LIAATVATVGIGIFAESPSAMQQLLIDAVAVGAGATIFFAGRKLVDKLSP
jgi:hypothetical protein